MSGVGGQERRVVFHLGYHKTGSSSLQKWFQDHAAVLTDDLLCFNLADGSSNPLKFATHRFVMGAGGAGDIEAEARRLRDRIAAAVQPRVLYSDEGLLGLPLGFRRGAFTETGVYPRAHEIIAIVARELAEFAPTFVAFERESEAWLASVHNQMARQGCVSRDFEAYLDRFCPSRAVDWPGLRAVLTAGIADNGRLQVLNFEHEFSRTSVWDMEFFKLLDLPTAARDRTRPTLERVNRSVPLSRCVQGGGSERSGGERDADQFGADHRAEESDMSLGRDKIILAYQLFLGRKPSEKEVARKVNDIRDTEMLRRAFIGSPEFSRVFRKMRRGDDRPTVIHLHIPKTAGSSLNSILGRGHAQDEILAVTYQTMNKLHDMDEAARRKLKVVRGHLPYGVDRLLPQSSIYLCLLRSPKPRLLSLYRYVLRAKDHPLHEECVRSNMSFGDFLCLPRRRPGLRADLDNGQIRRIANQLSAKGFGNEADIFEQALVNMFAPNMQFGLTEHFDDFLVRLESNGLISDSTPVSINVSPETTGFEEEESRLTRRERRLLEEYTVWDQRFYDLCSRVYFHPANRSETAP